MHIVYVHRGVYPERIGGTYTYIHELGRRLVARGHAVDVIASTREPGQGEPSTLEGMTVHRYPFVRVHPVTSTLQHLAKTCRTYASIASRHPVDILSVQDAQLGMWAARSRIGRAACRVPTFHAPGFLEYRLNTAWQVQDERRAVRRAWLRAIEPAFERWQRGFETRVLSAADAVVVLSQYTRGLIEQHFPAVPLERVRVIPGGVDTGRFRPAGDRAAVRRALGIPPDAVCLLTVRNLSPRMGLKRLVDAMPRILASDGARGRDVRLLVCGEGRLRPTLESAVRERGLAGRVELRGRVTDDDLVRHYQAADLFVLPTQEMEGFGIVTIEALSVNLPVVGTPAGATPEILERIDPRLVTRDTSADAIADGVISWLERSGDERGTTRYRAEALTRYDWERVTDEVERYYEESLEAFRKRH